MNNSSYDICLIFPPDAGIEFSPPAGIPSIVAYLKTHGSNPCVLDMNSVFHKSFFGQRMLMSIQEMLFSIYNHLVLEKENFEFLDSKLKPHKFIIKVKSIAISFLYIFYTYITFLRIFFFRLEKKRIQSLENIFEVIENNKETQIIERRFMPILEYSIKNIKIIGISVMYPQQIFYSLMIAKLAKKINRDIFIVLGGAQITMHTQKFLNNKKLLDYIDGFIVHEGEVGLNKLLRGGNPELIPNFYYKKGDCYEPSKNNDFVMPVKEYMTPDFEGFNKKIRNYNSLPIRTLRGCHWGRCRFCAHPYGGGKFDMTSADFVVKSIKRLNEEYNFNKFEFIDSSLPANFLQQIAEKIIEYNLNINWYCRVNYETAFRNSEFIALLKQSGCERLAFGLESANERVFRYMNKLQKDKETVLEVTKTLKSHGIISGIYVMFGFPTETKEEIEETLDFVMMLKLRYRAEPMFSVFNLLEHTYIYNNPNKFKIEKILENGDNCFQGYGYQFICTEGASRKEAYSLWNKAVLFNIFPFLYSIRKVLFH